MGLHAMILAAGRGERMRPLTDQCPKPLLEVGGRALIVWQIERLVAGGFTELVINHAWLGDRIEAALGDGRRFGAHIRYSAEGSALETLGGVVRALPLLGDAPFAVVSADIYTEYDYTLLAQRIAAMSNAAEGAHDETGCIAHLVLTDNPPYHPAGDMALVNGRIARNGARLNYGNIGVFHPSMFAGLPQDQPARLFPWAYDFIDAPGISGEHFRGVWHNVGTPQQLAALDAELLRTHARGSSSLHNRPLTQAKA